MTLENIYKLYLNHPTICTDTRKLTEGCLFFALKGDNFNGNLFAKQALEQGAAYVVIDEEIEGRDERFILVQNVLETLQKLATYHREQLNLPLIAIVGSNGKTSTKELVSSVLQQKFSVLSTPGNLNNHIGLPLTLLQLTNTHQIAVIEMGANHEKENAFLCEIAKPSCGIVTNNGKDHLEGFGSIEGVIRSNSELFVYLEKTNGLAFVNGNDAVLMSESAKVKNRKIYQQSAAENIGSDRLILAPTQLQPNIVFTYQNQNIQSSLSGDYNFDNILAAISIGKYFGLNPTQIKNGIESYKPKNLRSEWIKKEHNSIFLDAYNANPSSMELSIKNFVAMPGENKILCLGDMFELGKYEAEEHQNMVHFCLNLGLKNVLLVGKAFAKTEAPYLKFSETQEAANYIKDAKFSNCTFFLKGSRGMKMECLVEVIS
ncbi:MAG: UDP-N-acetylmuramoyl-tripeptide--D-alanyl-D-alanine ligase [Bacteroidia bacterium]|nr:UDP-N-acetylmuramoyl-tripeptide--D-alanyl-D-alanine ligase [Bacteroidia bacterium]